MFAIQRLNHICFSLKMVCTNLQRNFLLKAFGEQVRVDERRLQEFRPVLFDFNKEQRGHVTVRQGNTVVLALVTAVVARPFPDRPTEGVVAFHVNLPSTGIPIEIYQ